MKLHWSPRSPFVRKVMIAAHELGLTDRIEKVRSRTSMLTPNPALQRDNPLSKIPTLVLADGTVLIDSVVICEYFDDLAGGHRLFPPAGPARWDALSRHALATGMLDIIILWRNEREKPEDHQTAAWLAAFANKVELSLDRLNRLIAVRPIDGLDIGDLAFGVALSYLDFRFQNLDWRTGRPALTAWHAHFVTRPSVIATEVVDDL